MKKIDKILIIIDLLLVIAIIIMLMNSCTVTKPVVITPKKSIYQLIEVNKDGKETILKTVSE